MKYLGETEKTDAEVEQWNTRFLKEKPVRYERQDDEEIAGYERKSQGAKFC